MKLASTFALLAPLISSALSVSFIVPGAVWSDTGGARIAAHGGHVMKVGSTFYWLGYSNAAGVRPNIYTSTDMMNWSHVGVSNSAPSGMYRPKLVYSSGKWYILGQVNRNVVTLVQSGSTPASTAYSVVGSPTLLPPDSRSYSDQGSAYLLTSADSNNLQINHINGGSPITIGSRAADIEGALEAPGMFKANGIYFVIVSQKTGWRSNPNKLYWATSITGSWSGGTDIAPESTNTYNSQNTAELVLKGSSTTAYIFMGDAWDSTGSDNSNYEWLPMQVSTSAHTVTLQDFGMWKIDPNTGVVTSSGFANTTFHAADGIVGGSAVINKRAVHNITPTSNVTFTNIPGGSANANTNATEHEKNKKWVSFLYTLSNSTSGHAHVSINGGTPINLHDLNSRAGHYSTVPVALELAEDKNTLTFGVAQSQAGEEEVMAHLEGIQVFDEY